MSDLAADLNDLPVDQISLFRLEQTKRLRSCTEHLSIIGVGRDLLLHAIVTAPFDGYVSVLMKLSSNESDDSQEPILWAMLDQQASSPLLEAQEKLAELLDMSSDLVVAMFTATSPSARRAILSKPRALPSNLNRYGWGSKKVVVLTWFAP